METMLIFLGVIGTVKCVCFTVDVVHALFFRKKKVRNYKAIC